MPHVSIIGGGIAGLSAAWYLQQRAAASGQEIAYTLFEADDRLGGKLVLQTHKFFGSVKDTHAGTRGFEIAKILQEELSLLESVEVWLDTIAVAVFSDEIVGVVKDHHYHKIKPKKLLVATGARLVGPGVIAVGRSCLGRPASAEDSQEPCAAQENAGLG